MTGELAICRHDRRLRLNTAYERVYTCLLKQLGKAIYNIYDMNISFVKSCLFFQLRDISVLIKDNKTDRLI